MDEEVVKDFRESFNDQYEKAASCILKLENDGTDSNVINELFRAFHTLKGNFSMCQLDVLTKVSHATEDVIDSVRKNKTSFEAILGEVMLLVLDKIKEVSEDIFHDREIDEENLLKIESLLLTIKENEGDQLRTIAAEVISLLSGQQVDENYLQTFNLTEIIKNDQMEKVSVPESKKSQLEYFEELALLLETKYSSWENRIQRTLQLALAINLELDNPEDALQLKAAVYLHDIAHAFLNDNYMENGGKLTDTQKKELQKHPSISANFLRHIPGWGDAQEIILQHHERWDGTGYPAGINGNEIRIGAQILAVIDAFESMTHCRPDRKHKRSILRAMTEINNYSGKQFSPHITSVFNTVIRDKLAKS